LATRILKVAEHLLLLRVDRNDGAAGG